MKLDTYIQPVSENGGKWCEGHNIICVTCVVLTCAILSCTTQFQFPVRPISVMDDIKKFLAGNGFNAVEVPRFGLAL